MLITQQLVDADWHWLRLAVSTAIGCDSQVFVELYPSLCWTVSRLHMEKCHQTHSRL